MFGGSWSEEGTSHRAGCSQALPGQLPDVAVAGPLIHIGNATRPGVSVGRTKTYPSRPAAQASQATGRAAGKRSYSHKVKQSLDEMAQLLEIPTEVRVELSDEDIVAMSIQYLKKITAQGGVHQIPREPHKDIPLNMYLAALDGFVLHVDGNGRVRYISQNILEYLGFTAEQMVGKRILDFIHPTDRADLENVLAVGFINNESCQCASNNRLELFLRMRHQFQKQSHVLNNDGYTVIHCVGFVETGKSFDESRHTNRWGPCPCLCVIGRPLKPSFILKYHTNMAAFVIRSDSKLQPNFADSELLRLLGYSAWEFSSCTLYQHVHPSDTVDLRRSHQTVLRKGQSLSHYYRMLTKFGESVWMQTQFSLVCNSVSPSSNCIVSLNYILGGERRVGGFSAPSCKILNSVPSKTSQFTGQSSVMETASCNTCKICEGDCCYKVPNTVPLCARETTLKCDSCDSHTMLSKFSKRSTSHVEPNNATHLQLQNISDEQGRSSHTPNEIIHNKCVTLPRYNEGLSTAYSELLQEPWACRRSPSQSTVGVYKRYEDQTCHPETNSNFMADAGNSRATPPQLSSIPRSPMNNFNSLSTVDSLFQREVSDPGTESQVTSATPFPNKRDIKQCQYRTQHQSYHKSPETFSNSASQPIMNSFNDKGRIGGPIETYDTRSSATSKPSNSETLLQNIHQPLSAFGNTAGWSSPTHSDKNSSQITGNYNQLLSASNIPNVETSSAPIQAEMNCGGNYGAVGPNVTSESTIGHCQKFSGYLAESSTDCSTVTSSSSCMQQSNACVNQDCISSRKLDLPLASDTDTGAQNISNNDNFEPDGAILNDVMRQLDNRLGANWEIALQDLSGQQYGM